MRAHQLCLKGSSMNSHPTDSRVARKPPITVETEFGELPIGVFDLADLTKEHLQTIVRWLAHLEQKEERVGPAVNP